MTLAAADITVFFGGSECVRAHAHYCLHIGLHAQYCGKGPSKVSHLGHLWKKKKAKTKPEVFFFGGQGVP